MELPTLSGAQKTRLRGLGQTLEAKLTIGHAGVTPHVLAELNGLLLSDELVKVRYTGFDRHQRAELSEAVAGQAPCIHAGSVGAVALFYRPHPEEDKRKISV